MDRWPNEWAKIPFDADVSEIVDFPTDLTIFAKSITDQQSNEPKDMSSHRYKIYVAASKRILWDL